MTNKVQIGKVYRPIRHKGKEWIVRKAIGYQQRASVSLLVVERLDRSDRKKEYMGEHYFLCHHRRVDEWQTVYKDVLPS